MVSSCQFWVTGVLDRGRVFWESWRSHYTVMWVYCRQHLYTLGGLHYKIQMACHATIHAFFVRKTKQFKIQNTSISCCYKPKIVNVSHSQLRARTRSTRHQESGVVVIIEIIEKSAYPFNSVLLFFILFSNSNCLMLK